MDTKNEISFEPFDFEQTDIAGVPVYYKHFEFAPCVHIRIGLNYGAIHDEPGKEGTAHFLEHMIFDGSSMFADEKETQEFGKTVLLDSLNAYTGLFELFVTAKSLPHNFSEGLKGIMSMIIEPKLTEKSWAHEQKVITQEAWGKYLNETRIAYIKKERNNTLYDLPDRIRTGSALGWPDTILNIKHQDIQNAHQKFFVRSNMRIYIAGNIDAIGGVETLKQMLNEYLIKIPEGQKAKSPYIPSTIGLPKENRFNHTYEQVGISPRQQTSLSLSSIRPRMSASISDFSETEQKHMLTLNLTGELLGDLVFRKLRLENSWCYGAGASSTVTVDSLSLSMGGTIDPNHTEEAIKILWDIVDDIGKGEYREDFEKSKRLMIDNTLAAERISAGILDTAIESMKVCGRIIPLKKQIEMIETIAFQDIQAIISHYASREAMFIEIVHPSGQVKAESETETEDSE